jgi:hypothetical protein
VPRHWFITWTRAGLRDAQWWAAEEIRPADIVASPFFVGQQVKQPICLPAQWDRPVLGFAHVSFSPVASGRQDLDSDLDSGAGLALDSTGRHEASG